MKIASCLLGLVATLSAAVHAEPAPAPAAASAAAASTSPAEPNVQRKVVEDDNVRIEELRVRGQVQRITVQSKVPGAKPYEIVPQGTGRDPSQAPGAAGHSVWHMFSF